MESSKLEQNKIHSTIELRDSYDSNKLLPIVATGAEITIKEQFAKVELSYTFLNLENKRPVDIHIHKIEGTHSGDVKVQKVKSDMRSLLLILDGTFPTTPECLASSYSIIQLNEEINANEYWRVTYTFFWPIDSPKGGSACYFTLPSEVYQITYEENVFRSYADIVNSHFKFTELKGYVLAPYEIYLKEIVSSLEIKNIEIKINSSHNVCAKISGETSIDSNNFPVVSDFEVKWERVFVKTNEPISIVEFKEKESCYYLYLKAFPWNELACEGLEVEVNSSMSISPSKTYLFTIVLDTGKNVLKSDHQIMARHVVKHILSKLPDKQCKFRIITPPKKGEIYSDKVDLKEVNEENKLLAYKKISEIIFKDEETDIISVLTKMKEEVKLDSTDKLINRVILISSNTIKNLNLISNALVDIKEIDAHSRFYFISVLPQIDYELKTKFEEMGSGLGVSIKDDFDLDEKVDSILKSCLELYNFKFTLQCPEFEQITNQVINQNFWKTVRPVEDSFDFLTRFYSTSKFPSKFTINISVENCEGNKVNFIKAITLETDLKNNFFLSEIYNDILSFKKCLMYNKKMSRSLNVVEKQGKALIKFDVIYGETRQTLLFDANSHMEVVKNEIIEKLGVKNLNFSSWMSEGLTFDFSKHLNEFTKDQMGCTIEIPLPEKVKETIPISELHFRISKLVNNNLFAFDPKFIIDIMGVSKEDWQEFEKKLNANKEVSKKLFKIDKGINKENRNLVFSFYCLFYINNYLSENACEIVDAIDKVTHCLTSKFGYDVKKQEEFDSFVTFKPTIF